MRIQFAALVIGLIACSSALLAQNAPTAVPSAGSAFQASGTGGIDFELTIAPGATLANADIDLTDADNPTNNQTLTLNSVTPNPGTPAGVAAPTTPQSGSAGADLTISWSGTVTASNAPGNYDFTINFQDDEGTPNVVQAVIRIIIDDVAPQGAQGTDATSSNPFAPANQTLGTTPSLDLCNVTDGNTGQTLTVTNVAAGVGNPASGTITVTNNGPIAGTTGPLVLTAVASGALTIADVGTWDFTVTVSDGGANTNVTFDLQIVVDPPEITVTSAGNPNEQGQVTGTYTVTCTPAPGANLTVNFQMSGTAAVASDTDYNLSSAQTLTYTTGPNGTIVVPAAGTATITLTPVDDALAENAETAILTATAGTGYTVGTPSNATLTIADNDSISISVAASGSPSETGPTAGTYTFTASQNVLSDTTINFQMSGTAATTGDYNLTSGGALSYTAPNGTIVMTNGTNSITVTLTPDDDALVEGTETAILTVQTGTGYTVGTPNSATMNIADNDAAPAAGSMSTSPSNPGAQTASPGSTRTGLVFRITETGGGTAFTVTSATVTISTNGTAAVAAVTSVSLYRVGVGTPLQTITNGGAGWSAPGNVITVSFSGLSSVVAAGGTGDFAVAISFSGVAVPTPNPTYSTTIAPADVNGGISGAGVTGGTITLAEQLPGDPLDDDDDDDSCNLATRGGPAWPLLLAGLLVALAALRRRKTA